MPRGKLRKVVFFWNSDRCSANWLHVRRDPSQGVMPPRRAAITHKARRRQTPGGPHHVGFFLFNVFEFRQMFPLIPCGSGRRAASTSGAGTFVLEHSCLLLRVVERRPSPFFFFRDHCCQTKTFQTRQVSLSSNTISNLMEQFLFGTCASSTQRGIKEGCFLELRQHLCFAQKSDTTIQFDSKTDASWSCRTVSPADA